MRALYGECLMHILCFRAHKTFCYDGDLIKFGEGTRFNILNLFQPCADGTASGAGLELVGISITRAPVAVTTASEEKTEVPRLSVSVSTLRRICLISS